MGGEDGTIQDGWVRGDFHSDLQGVALHHRRYFHGGLVTAGRGFLGRLPAHSLGDPLIDARDLPGVALAGFGGP
jgi:hypothetical protein